MDERDRRRAVARVDDAPRVAHGVPDVRRIGEVDGAHLEGVQAEGQILVDHRHLAAVAVERLAVERALELGAELVRREGEDRRDVGASRPAAWHAGRSAGAVVSGMISQLAMAGGFSVLPSRSVARTRKLWRPIARSAYSYGEVHSEKGSLSSEHSKVAPASETKLMMPSMPSTYSTWPVGASKMVVTGARRVGDDGPRALRDRAADAVLADRLDAQRVLALAQVGVDGRHRAGRERARRCRGGTRRSRSACSSRRRRSRSGCRPCCPRRARTRSWSRAASGRRPSTGRW